MVSFARLCEQMEEERSDSPLMDSGDGSRSISVLRSGKDMRKEDERSFWEEFIELCSNAEGMADLLNVSADQVRDWPAKIKQGLEDLEDYDSESHPDDDEQKEVIPTGNNGAVITPSNVDPIMGDIS